MSRTVRWWVAGLVVLAAFAGATWVSGAFILTRLLTSSADRWAVASGIGAALAGFAALWGQWWATRTDGTPQAASGGDAATGRGQVAAGGERSIAVGQDNTGVTSTGDDAVNTQNR